MLRNIILRKKNKSFYDNKLDEAIRFGDVLEGYVLSNAIISKPISLISNNDKAYKVDIKIPKYCVVLTPCCNIEKGSMVLTPLVELRSEFFRSSHLIKDFTLINREIEPYKAIPDNTWNKLSEEKKAEIENRAKAYTFAEIFVYDEHNLFNEYTKREKKYRYYMIEFTKLFYLKCDLIKREMKEKDKEILKSKICQINVETRKELREKLGWFFARTPSEDYEELQIL